MDHRAEASARADVAIIGGGPVGMALAIELGQRGVSTIVVERHRVPQPIPKGQNLTQRTMEHFHFWGIERELRAARTIPADFGIGGQTGYRSLLGDYRYDWLQRELVRPFYFTDNERLPQYETERVLRARAEALPSVAIRYGWTARELEQDAEGVTIAIEGGLAERETIRARWVVGCDGSRSIVRTAAGITQTLSDHDRLMALLVFRSRELSRLVERFPGKSFFNVLHPDQKGYWLFFGRVGMDDDWFFHAPVPRSAQDGGFDFPAYLRQAVGADFDIAIDHIGFWDLRFAIADRYRAGRAFVAGDAAHSHPPYGGYGINTGLEDARNLGWKLAAAVAGWGGETLLDSYHDERHAVFESTARDFIARAIESDRAFLEAHDPERDRAAFEAEWLARGSGARTEVGAFEPHYEGSPVVWGAPGAQSGAMGEHRLTARAGHHLAPCTLSSGRDVHQTLGGGFTLLAFGADEALVRALSTAAMARNMPLKVVFDEASVGCDRYGASLVLVRPDQFVAWAGGRPEPSPQVIVDRTLGIG